MAVMILVATLSISQNLALEEEIPVILDKCYFWLESNDGTFTETTRNPFMILYVRVKMSCFERSWPPTDILSDMVCRAEPREHKI